MKRGQQLLRRFPTWTRLCQRNCFSVTIKSSCSAVRFVKLTLIISLTIFFVRQMPVQMLLFVWLTVMRKRCWRILRTEHMFLLKIWFILSGMVRKWAQVFILPRMICWICMLTRRPICICLFLKSVLIRIMLSSAE